MERLNPGGEGVLEVAFGDRADEVEEVQVVGFTGQLLGQL